jgi:hypothetical protein
MFIYMQLCVQLCVCTQMVVCVRVCVCADVVVDKDVCEMCVITWELGLIFCQVTWVGDQFPQRRVYCDSRTKQWGSGH